MNARLDTDRSAQAHMLCDACINEKKTLNARKAGFKQDSMIRHTRSLPLSVDRKSGTRC